MTAWLKRERQTRTQVNSPSAEQTFKNRGRIAAYRTTAATQLSVQLLLWVTLAAYDRSAQTAWQAASLLAFPLAGLYVLWTAARKGLGAKSARFWLLALVPCLLADAAVLLCVMDAFMAELMPSYAPMLRLAIIGLLSLWAACGAQLNGVAYGVAMMKYPLLIAFVLCTFFLNAESSAERLYPLLGAGFGKTALTALGGIGSVWGVALMFAQPSITRADAALASGKRPSALLWTILPWALCIIWALWFGLVRPWRADDVVTIGERLMGLARNSRSIIVCQLAGLGWLLALPCALFGCIRSGESLLVNAFPKLSRIVGTLVILLPGAVYAFFCGSNSLGFIAPLLPYRSALSLAAAVGVLICAAGEAKRK